MNLLFHVLDGALGTTSKVRLLRALISLGRPVTGREAARLADVSQTAAVRALDDLVALGLLEREIEPSGHRYMANRENMLVRRALPALFRAEEEHAGAVVDALREAITSGVGWADRRRVRAVAVLEAGPPDAGRTLTLIAVVASKKDVDAARDALSVPASRLTKRFGIRISSEVLPLSRFRAQHDGGDTLIRAAVEDAIPITGDPLDALVG